jgi:arabinose-5-phosphate isomerase
MSPAEYGATVIRQEAKALEALSSRLGQCFIRAIAVVMNAKGKVVTTGIGKAGHVAAKFAATLASTRTPAVFMHPSEASHGDLGILDKGDVVFAFSVSGETREVIEAVRDARAVFGLRIIVMTSKGYSTLAREADVVLDIGDFEEACPLGLAPSTSMVMMMALGDAVAFALMRERGVTREDFAARHHGGYLGQKAREQIRVVN